MMWWAVLGVFVFIIAFFLQIFWWIPLQKRKCQSLNRRTGGRENIARVSASHKTLNRRTGGLETVYGGMLCLKIQPNPLRGFFTGYFLLYRNQLLFGRDNRV